VVWEPRNDGGQGAGAANYLDDELVPAGGETSRPA